VCASTCRVVERSVELTVLDVAALPWGRLGLSFSLQAVNKAGASVGSACSAHVPPTQPPGAPPPVAGVGGGGRGEIGEATFPTLPPDLRGLSSPHNR